MEGLQWIGDNWDKLLNSVGGIGALFIGVAALWSGVKTQRAANLITITTNHREIWMYHASHPELARVKNAFADVVRQPPTPDEAEFVNFVIRSSRSAMLLRRSAVYYVDLVNKCLA